jgi:hypothetical protein
MLSTGTTIGGGCLSFTVWNLADVYATIAFYHKHESEVKLTCNSDGSNRRGIRAMNQTKFDPQGLQNPPALARRTVTEPCC